MILLIAFLICIISVYLNASIYALPTPSLYTIIVSGKYFLPFLSKYDDKASTITFPTSYDNSYPSLIIIGLANVFRHSDSI